MQPSPCLKSLLQFSFSHEELAVSNPATLTQDVSMFYLENL